jgi:hypothetical protein
VAILSCGGSAHAAERTVVKTRPLSRGRLFKTEKTFNEAGQLVHSTRSITKDGQYRVLENKSFSQTGQSLSASRSFWSQKGTRRTTTVREDGSVEKETQWTTNDQDFHSRRVTDAKGTSSSMRMSVGNGSLVRLTGSGDVRGGPIRVRPTLPVKLSLGEAVTLAQTKQRPVAIEHNNRSFVIDPNEDLAAVQARYRAFSDAHGLW